MQPDDEFDQQKQQTGKSGVSTPPSTSDNASYRMFCWYALGCQLEGRQPMLRKQFEEQQLIQLLKGDLLTSEVFNRSAAEWELAREDALWTTILQRLSQLNVAPRVCDLVTTIQAGRKADEDGDTGSAGVPAYRPPFAPVLVGAGAKLHPALDPEPWCRDPG
jgi:hypothetical protein